MTLGIESRGLGRVPAESAAPPKTVTVRQTLSLDPGENVIEVVAYNAKDLIASLPAVVKIVREGTQAAARPRLHVVAIGINDYWDSRLQLNICRARCKGALQATSTSRCPSSACRREDRRLELSAELAGDGAVRSRSRDGEYSQQADARGHRAGGGAADGSRERACRHAACSRTAGRADRERERLDAHRARRQEARVCRGKSADPVAVMQRALPIVFASLRRVALALLTH